MHSSKLIFPTDLVDQMVSFSVPSEFESTSQRIKSLIHARGHSYIPRGQLTQHFCFSYTFPGRETLMMRTAVRKRISHVFSYIVAQFYHKGNEFSAHIVFHKAYRSLIYTAISLRMTEESFLRHFTIWKQKHMGE